MDAAIIDIDGLAVLLGRKRSSIATDMVRNPAAVPPHFKLPGTKRPLWLVVTVHAWLLSHAKRANAFPVRLAK